MSDATGNGLVTNTERIIRLYQLTSAKIWGNLWKRILRAIDRSILLELGFLVVESHSLAPEGGGLTSLQICGFGGGAAGERLGLSRKPQWVPLPCPLRAPRLKALCGSLLTQALAQ